MSKNNIDLGENYGVSRQKQKLLFMREILLNLTDEEHPITVNQLINILADNGIKEERKTVYDDIATLIGSGLSIEVTKIGHANAYYVAQRLFETEELFVLSDAVASSKFLTKKKSDELIKKLQTLTSKHLAKELLRDIDVKDRVKTYNDSIYYTISQINEGIINKKKLTFQYYTYGANKKKIFKHDGAWYVVSPYKLVWENDNYYLICYSERHGKIVYFRADKMVKVTAMDEKRIEPDGDQKDFIKKLRSTFDMYSGELERVTFEINPRLIDQMIDKFGDKIVVLPESENKVTFKADVQISPTFWGWLFQYGTDIKIIAPQKCAEMCKQELNRLLNNYL